MPPKIVLPKIKRVYIQGDQNVFDAFDFRDSGALIFRGAALNNDASSGKIDLSYFPDQTTSISLTSFEWNQKPAQPRYFQHLIELDLNMTSIHGTLGEYLSALNLKHLRLSMVLFKRLESTRYYEWTPLFADTRLLKGTPVLETFELQHGIIDENFVEGLESCIALKGLTLFCCDLSRFVSPFLERLESGMLVPSLDTFSISEPRGMNPNPAFEKLIRYFMAKRADVHLYIRN
jgi:hypothetical protein